MHEIPTNEPTELRAGLTWEWRREDLVDHFPANGGWALKYWFKKSGATGANFSIDATADGVNFAVTVAAATTAAFTAGDYTWSAVATKAGVLKEADKGRLKILPRYDQAANLDDRTHARKMLEAIEAVLESRASSTQREMVAYSIGNRSKTFDAADSKTALLALHSKYKWLVANESGESRDIKIRFRSP